jgi:hypothetical protein
MLKLVMMGVFLSMFLAACNLPSSTPNAAATLQAVYTAQAGTVQALQTQAGVASGSTTPAPTIIFPTLPAVTVSPSLTPQVYYPPPTPMPITYCDWAAFVKDVSVNDGSVFAPGAQFTKTWRLKNIGTCTWTTSYGLVFLKGNNMNGMATTRMPANVNPGQSVDVSVDLTAPSSEGSYRGYWLLRNNAGDVFGLGGAAADPFYVDIRVVGSSAGGPLTTIFDFATNYCNATWRSGAGLLGCPGDATNNNGYVIYVDNPQLENGQIYNGPGLLMAPENTNNGYLQGYYPPFSVKNGDRFRATINCEYLANGCNAIFRLDYQINDGPVKNIWQYLEAYEGQYYTVDADLSPLAGNSVKFILTVLSNGSATYDKLIWAGPRIERLSNLVPPSATPTNRPSSTPTSTLTSLPTSTPTVTATATVTTTPVP